METNTTNTALVVTDTNPAALLQLAVQKDLDIEKLKQLMELQERSQARQARMTFLEALSKFQSIVPPLEKTKKVAFGTTRYSYAPLGEIAATIKEPMRECGLSHRWEMQDTDANIICTCIISHKDGHSEKTTMSAGKDASGGKNEIQQRGSTITYLQRYTLIAALGISTADEDVDGQQPVNGVQPQNQNKPQPEGKPQPIKKTEKKPEPTEWLNKFADGKKTDFTKAYLNTIKKLRSREVTLQTVYDNYKVNKELRAELEALVKEIDKG